MLKDPERFIQEKLSKKVLSVNTIRDGIIAAFLITLQKRSEQDVMTPELGNWRKAKAGEVRAIMSKAFAEIDAPFEYPSILQLKKVKEAVESAYAWDRVPEALKKDFDSHCDALFKKIDL